MRKLNYCFIIIFFILFYISLTAQTGDYSQNLGKLTVEKIMRDPEWIGTSPSRVHWSEDGKTIYFMWNPDGLPGDSLYSISREGSTPQKVSFEDRLKLPSFSGNYSEDRTKKVYQKNGDIFILDIKNGRIKQVTNTLDWETNPQLTNDEKNIVFEKKNNLYLWNMETGITEQITDFRSGKKPAHNGEAKTKQLKWLENQQMELIKVLRERKEKKEKAKELREAEKPVRPKEIYVEDKSLYNLLLGPKGEFVTFSLYKDAKDKNTEVPNYVTESGYTDEIKSRPNVGGPKPDYEFGIYDIKNDTVIYVSADSLPGITNKPEYLKDYEKAGSSNKKEEEAKPKKVVYFGPVWSDDGTRAMLEVRSLDNKDRWITLLNPSTGELKTLDWQHDEAWIGGPGIPWYIGKGDEGWLPDNETVWFQSEETGYSHIFTVNVLTGKKTKLTKGNYEVYDPQISKDKKFWYFTANKIHPGVHEFYRMPLKGGEAEQITTMAGSNRVFMSPDEERLAILQSVSNRPWELFVSDNKPGAEAERITHSTTPQFESYKWRKPEVITFTARDGAKVYARVYRPENPQPNGPGVIFVHGAGYLQDAHKWWSSYFREYMFNNLLADNGYTVLDIDYRGSAGYGRDWRTAIYRNMGGKDLTDQIDGAKYMVDNYNVSPERIGIYGGSYGGFITLMAMFKTPGIFAAGAGLRSVTDWSHYNDTYTANILNTPVTDSLAYVKSSPIYYADGLKGALLMCHGVVDQNVHFQDIIRLTQRLIELGKDNWELAVFPLEDHGFVEPSSWTDEYKRIFKLFENNLK